MQTEPNPAISDTSPKASPAEDLSSIALAKEDRPSIINQPVLFAEPVINQSLATVDQAALARLVAPENANYQLSTINHLPTVIDAKPLPVAATQRRKSR